MVRVHPGSLKKGMKMRYLILAIFAFSLATSAECADVIYITGPMGDVAAKEASMQADRGRMGHIFGCPKGASFAGVGMGSGSRPSTCTPRRPMTLVGDAVARGANGRYYRSRYWK